MAWNNKGGGRWGGGGNKSGGGGAGGGGGGPWGGGPFGWRRPPDMEDVIRKGQERLRNLIPGGFGSFKGILLIVLAAIVIWMLTGFLRVQPNQQAVPLLFGKPYGGPAASGPPINPPGPPPQVVGVALPARPAADSGSAARPPRPAPPLQAP